jgi:hypothetical protein
MNLDYSIFDNITETNKKDIDTLYKFKRICDDHDILLCIFSAAPRSWCETILSKMGNEYLKDIPILSDTTEGLLKPDKLCYARIEIRFRGNDIIFIDDKLINLLPVHGNTKWTNYLLCDMEEGFDEIKHVTKNLHMISDLSSLIVDDEFVFTKFTDSILYLETKTLVKH